MRKLFTNKNKKGFAMAELLAVSIVLLFIFSILFSNYLPLLAEYETRLSYNDVTAQYAAHYIRKMYVEALENNDDFDDTHSISEQFKTIINSDIENYGYYPYGLGNSSDKICDILSTTGKQDECKKIIDQYDIEEIIITNYKLKDDNDSNTKYVKKGYAKNDGDLYNYIHYLPNYEKSIYTGKDEDSGEQLYRIILKTKDFGYATTPILYDYKTPGSCFKGEYNGPNTLKITEYLYNEGNGCGSIVTIKNSSVKLANGVSGKITEIGDNVFSRKSSSAEIYPAYNVKQIILSDKVNIIGDRAFEGSYLEKLPILDKITSIGDYAFANTRIQEADLTNYPSTSTIGNYAFSSNENLTTVKFKDSTNSPTSIIIGNYAFANNKNLGTVTLPNSNIYSTNKDDSGNLILAKGLFKESGTSASGIGVTIPSGMKYVGEEMFYLAKIKSITLENGVLTIGTKAFSQYDDTSFGVTGSCVQSVSIPGTTEKIGDDSFRNLLKKPDETSNIDPKITFEDGTSTLEIGTAAFKENEIKYVTIPSRVSRIGSYAFDSSKIEELTFRDVKDLTSIEKYAFNNNKIEKLELPNSINRIESYAFANNINLNTLSFNNVSYIGERAFTNTGIKNLVIPSNVTIIESTAFYRGQLEKLVIEDGEKSLYIRGSAFLDNPNLNEIIIPARVSSIKPNAFSGIKQDAEIKNSSKITESKDWCNIFDANNSTCSGSMENENKMKITYMDVSNNEIRRYIYMGGATNE